MVLQKYHAIPFPLAFFQTTKMSTRRSPRESRKRPVSRSPEPKSQVKSARRRSPRVTGKTIVKTEPDNTTTNPRKTRKTSQVNPRKSPGVVGKRKSPRVEGTTKSPCTSGKSPGVRATENHSVSSTKLHSMGRTRTTSRHVSTKSPCVSHKKSQHAANTRTSPLGLSTRKSLPTIMIIKLACCLYYFT